MPYVGVQSGYNDRLQAIYRQQSLALNQLQQASLSRTESLLGAADLLSQAAASLPSPHGLAPLAFGPGAGFDTSALNSPMTPQPQARIQASVLLALHCVQWYLCGPRLPLDWI